MKRILLLMDAYGDNQNSTQENCGDTNSSLKTKITAVDNFFAIIK